MYPMSMSDLHHVFIHYLHRGHTGLATRPCYSIVFDEQICACTRHALEGYRELVSRTNAQWLNLTTLGLSSFFRASKFHLHTTHFITLLTHDPEFVP